MKAIHEVLSIRTRGTGTYEITDDVEKVVRASGVTTGTATDFVRHTSASLVIYGCSSWRKGNLFEELVKAWLGDGRTKKKKRTQRFANIF